MTIRPECPVDQSAVRHVHEEAFGRPNEAELVEAIRRSPGFVPELSLVAEEEARVVGHILFNGVCQFQTA